MLNIGRRDDENTQTVALTANTQTTVRVWTAGRYELYSAAELRMVRGPSVYGADGSATLPSDYELIPAGQGIVIDVTRKQLASAMRLRGEHFVDFHVWDLVGQTLRVARAS